jgi:hypothetical protein
LPWGPPICSTLSCRKRHRPHSPQKRRASETGGSGFLHPGVRVFSRLIALV